MQSDYKYHSVLSPQFKRQASQLQGRKRSIKSKYKGRKRPPCEDQLCLIYTSILLFTSSSCAHGEDCSLHREQEYPNRYKPINLNHVFYTWMC